MIEISILSVSVGVILSILVIVIFNLLSKRMIIGDELKRYNIDMYLDITFDEVNTMIDNYISNIFDTYVILEGYAINSEVISQKEENDINRDIGTLVGSRMSKPMHDKICLFFSTNSIPDVLSEKIGMMVMNYRINHNNNVEQLINQERENRQSNKK